MGTITNAERIMRLETNLTNLDRKVDDGFSRLDNSLKEISTQIQLALPTLVTHDLMTSKVQELEEKILELKIELEKEKKANNLQTWVTGTLSAVFGVVLALLVQHYITSR